MPAPMRPALPASERFHSKQVLQKPVLRCKYAAEQTLVLQHDTLMINIDDCGESGPVEHFEAVAIRIQACIGLRLRLHLKLWSANPRSADLAPLADCHWLATDRECVREWRRPDIDVQASLKCAQRPPCAILPAALAIRTQLQRVVARGAGHSKIRLAQTP